MSNFYVLCAVFLSFKLKLFHKNRFALGTFLYMFKIHIDMDEQCFIEHDMDGAILYMQVQHGRYLENWYLGVGRHLRASEADTEVGVL